MPVFTCTLFYSYFRMYAAIDTITVFGLAAVPSHAKPSARVLFNGTAPMQKTECRRLPGGVLYEVVIEALVDPTAFPGDGELELTLGNTVARLSVAEQMQLAAANQPPSLVNRFKTEIGAWVVAHAPARPTLLDIGGRARSGVQRSEHYPECDVTTFDVVADSGVDVVGDAHELSRHFPPASFDFAHSVAVFEHLVMPWKVAVEMNHVLKTGGMAMILTHQTLGMHDLPWDFFRFSDASWTGLFNRETGFEIVQTVMSHPVHIIPRLWTEHYRQAEAAVGFEVSAVIVRKTGDPTVSWDVAVPDILKTNYPRGSIGRVG